MLLFLIPGPHAEIVPIRRNLECSACSASLLLHRAALRALFQVQLVRYCVRMCARVQCTSSKTGHLGTATGMARQDPLWGPFSQGCTKTDVASGLSLGSPAKSFTSKSWGPIGPMQRSQE